MYRMKDLASQAANDTNGTEDRAALQSEMDELNAELTNIMDNTKYAGENLFGATGKFSKEMNFQIGASEGESLKVNVKTELDNVTGSGGMGALTASGALTTVSGAQAMMTSVEGAISEVGTLRSKLGANINRLGHTAANLAYLVMSVPELVYFVFTFPAVLLIMVGFMLAMGRYRGWTHWITFRTSRRSRLKISCNRR